jgi:HTH-type transcriptional regulator/antitoxin HigA
MAISATVKRSRSRIRSKSHANGNPLPPAYLRLVKRFRLRPVRSDDELDQATALVDALLSRKEPLLPEEEEYLEVLSDLIEQYENDQVAIPDVSAADLLRFLIEQRHVTQQTVAREIGIANSTLSALLTDHRAMTRKHMEAFARYFGVAPAVFLPG